MWKWVLIQRSIEHVQGFYCTNNCNSHYFLCIVSPTICDFEKFDKIHHYLSSSPLNPQNEFENPWHPLIVHRFCLLKLSVEPIYEFLYLIDHRSSNVDCKIPWQVKLLKFSILAEKYFWHFLHGYMSEIRPFQLPQGKVDQSWKSPKIIFEFLSAARLATRFYIFGFAFHHLSNSDVLKRFNAYNQSINENYIQ